MTRVILGRTSRQSQTSDNHAPLRESCMVYGAESQVYHNDSAYTPSLPSVAYSPRLN